MVGSREGYNFTYEQKHEALENSFYQCECCGGFESKKTRLEIHHQIAIWFAKECGIPQTVIKSIADTAVLCHDCHVKIHRQESRHQYAYLTWFLFGIDVEYDESKDDWRKDPNHPINIKENYDDTRNSKRAH